MAPKILDPANYKVAWIAPLSIEAKAALLMLDVHHQGKFVVHRGDDYIYKAGEINGHNIVIATFPADHDYGVGSAAALASQVKKSFPNLWFGLLVGVAAGLPNFDRTPPLDIRLGDVLVGVGDSKSAGLVSYGLGRQTKDGFELIRHGYQAKTEAIVRSAITSLELEDFQLSLQKKPHAFLEYYEHIKESDKEGIFADPGQDMDKLHRTIHDSSGPILKLIDRDERPVGTRTRVWHGPIGSGDKLMRDAKMRDELRDEHNIIGLEMEAAGIENTIPVGVIRGVCDYGDDQKDKNWQPYAAAMAAAYAKAILYQITPDRGGTVAESAASSARSQAQQESDNNIERQRFPSTLPTYSNHMFSGREEELAQIEQILRNSPPFHQRICLYGLGSIGKSQIAFKYAQKWSTRRSVFWVKADTAENLESGYSAIAYRVMPNFQQGKVEDVFAAVKECLERPDSPPWLMVLDGADDTEVFFSNQKDINRLKYLPQAPHGRILFTSRDDRLLSLAGGQLVSPENGLRIGPMSIQDGTTLFKKLIPHDHRGLHVQILAPQGARFLDMLGGLPLAIVQATLFMTLEGKTIQGFIDLYKQVEEHDRIFEQAATDIDLQMISVLRTWEISYTRIAKAATPEAKSQAAMLLDLLGFIDSKSSPILRNLSEAEFVFRDIEGHNPMDGFKEFSERRPSLEMFKAQSNPRALLFRVFSNRITPNTESDFTSATAKLQRYSLIDEECWVPPVVHGWISLRLKAEERCKYIKWLVEDLWHQILLCDDYFDTRWRDFFLPPNYHELVFHELPPLRHARVLLDHASSKTVLDSMTQGNYFAAHDVVDLLYRLGNMLASAGRNTEGIHYLQKAIEAMESLTPRLPSTVVSERRLQLAKTRYRICDIADAVDEAKSLENETHSTKAALWLAQCLQIAGELEEASVIFQNIIALLQIQRQSDPGIPNEPDFQKLIFAASFGAVSTLATMGDSNKKTEARNIIEKHLIPFLRYLYDDNILKVVLYPEVLILRLEVAASTEDQKKIVQTFIDYDLRRDPMAEGMSLTGGKPIDWVLRLNELRHQKRWSAIIALGETFLERRRSFTYLWNLRLNEENGDQFDLLRAEIDAWIIIHYRLGTAYSELQQTAKAGEAHWAALGLSLGLWLLPPTIHAAQFEANLWRLQNILESQKKLRSHQIILSFFQTYIDKEAARRKQGS